MSVPMVEDLLVVLGQRAELVHEVLVGLGSFDFGDEGFDDEGVDAGAAPAGHHLCGRCEVLGQAHSPRLAGLAIELSRHQGQPIGGAESPMPLLSTVDNQAVSGVAAGGQAPTKARLALASSR